jgi:hypothetical protein
MTARHPCEFSREVLEVISPLLHPGEHVHDPFAGTGRRLGALCDQLGLTFTGSDIEGWPDHDPRVAIADALDPNSYPTGLFTVVTSPVYENKRLADYRNGPTPTTKTKGRRDYGIALGRALHTQNLARLTGRRATRDDYDRQHASAVALWGPRVILNVDAPISTPWCQVLEGHGYRVDRVLPAYTQRYGGLANAELRADHEVVIEAARSHGGSMPGHLFDPTPYGARKPEPQLHRGTTIVNDGGWWLLPQVGRPLHGKAHRKADIPRNAYGADSTMCGRRSQLIQVPEGIAILAACEDCETKRSTALSDASWCAVPHRALQPGRSTSSRPR